MSQLYAISLAVCLGASVTAALLLCVFPDKVVAYPPRAQLAPFSALACVLGGCLLAFAGADTDEARDFWARCVGLFIPGVAGLFGHSLTRLTDSPQTGLWGRLLALHKAASGIAMAALLVGWLASLRGEGAAERIEWAVSWGYATASVGVLSGSLYRMWRSRGLSALTLGSVVFSACLVRDFAWWLGFSASPSLQSLGLLSYLGAHLYEQQRGRQQAWQTLRANQTLLETHRKRLILDAAQLQRERLQRLSALSAGIVHEMNNPIQGIMNYAGMLRMSLRDRPTAREFLDKIDDEADRIAKLARGISRFGEVEEEADAVTDAAQVIHEALGLARSTLRREEIVLSVDVAPGLPAVNLPQELLQQVLLQLVHNAREALAQRNQARADEKTLAIVVRAEQQALASRVVCTVRDNADGMTPEVRARLFTPFFTTKPESTHRGLGLFTAQSIVEAFGGTLRLAETGAAGSVMVLELACARTPPLRESA